MTGHADPPGPGPRAVLPTGASRPGGEFCQDGPDGPNDAALHGPILAAGRPDVGATRKLARQLGLSQRDIDLMFPPGP